MEIETVIIWKYKVSSAIKKKLNIYIYLKHLHLIFSSMFYFAIVFHSLFSSPSSDIA